MQRAFDLMAKEQHTVDRRTLMLNCQLGAMVTVPMPKWGSFVQRAVELLELGVRPPATFEEKIAVSLVWRFHGATSHMGMYPESAGAHLDASRVSRALELCTKSATSVINVMASLQHDDPRRIALVGDTADDVRHVMVEGPSGVLAIAPADERPVWQRSLRRLEWPNGVVARCYSAADPEQLRGGGTSG